MTRRRLVQAGAAGAAVVGLGSLGPLEGLAAAAPGGVPAELRRTTYLSLASKRFEVTGVGGTRTLTMISVDDLQAPDLVGRDDAFSVTFRGDGQPLESAIHTLDHPELGRFELFVSPVDQASGTPAYELLVDRTVALPGSPGGDSPARSPGAEPAADLRLLAASLKRGSGRRLLVEGTLASADADLVRASLIRRGRAIARAVAWPQGTGLRLRFRPRYEADPGRYLLRLEISDRSGHVTTVRKSLRLR